MSLAFVEKKLIKLRVNHTINGHYFTVCVCARTHAIQSNEPVWHMYLVVDTGLELRVQSLE